MSNNVLSGIIVPDGKTVAVVIYCRDSYCGCLHLFFRALSESDLWQEEVWRAHADVRFVPPAAYVKKQFVEQFPQALVLQSYCCISMDAPDLS